MTIRNDMNQLSWFKTSYLCHHHKKNSILANNEVKARMRMLSR